MYRLNVLLGGAVMLLFLVQPSFQPAVAAETSIFADGFEENASAQITAARSAPDGPSNILIETAIVTYIKPLIGNDSAGFFVQAKKTGPALFVAVDPSTLTPQPVTQDEVSFRITEMATNSGLRLATQVTNFSRSATLKPLGNLIQNVSASTDLVSSLDTYESELIALNGVISGAFAASGTGFESAVISTPGMIGDSGLRLRIPSALRDSLDLVSGCEFTLGPTPMWRFLTQAQPSAWQAADINATSCPPPTVVSALPQSATSVVINFSRHIQPASVEPGGGQFVFDNALIASAASVSGRQVTVSTSAQLSGQAYQVTVQNTVTDTLGNGLQIPNSAAFLGFAQNAQVLINEVNANINSSCDLIEFRVMSGGSMDGFQLWERNSHVLTFTGLNVDAGDTIIVHFNSPTAGCPGSPDETLSRNQHPTFTYASNYDSSWDWHTLDAGLVNTDNVITLYDSQGVIQDAVFLSDDATGLAAVATETQAAAVAASGAWEMVGGGIPSGGFIDDNFNAHAVQDLNATSTSAVGTTIQRTITADTDTKSDWGMAEPTWGALNPGQTP